MDQKWLKVLSGAVLFEGISEDTLGVIINCLQPKVCCYQKNSYIANVGEEFSALGIMLSGKASVIKESITGNTVIMTILNPGDMFGEVAAFSSNRIWPISVCAKTDCTVLFLPLNKVVERCENSCGCHQELIYNMLRVVSDRAVMLNKRLEYFTIKSLRSKISTYLFEHYLRQKKETFELPLNRNELAGFLNVSRESLSREMCRMRDEGLIDFYQSSIRIKDMETLKELAE